MRSGSEEATWRYVKQALTGWYLERHTDKLNGGVPDVFWGFRTRRSLTGQSGWIELKQRDTPTQQLDIRQDQLVNLWQKQRTGVSAVVLCQTGSVRWDLWIPRHATEWLGFLQQRPAPDVTWDEWPGAQVLYHTLVEAPLWGPLALDERRH